MRVERVVLMAAVLLAASRPVRADELAEVTQFIAGRTELASIAGKVAKKVGDGTYRVEVGKGPTQVFVVKAGKGWAAALTVEPKALELSSLIPSAVLGDSKVETVVLALASGDGGIEGEPLGIKGLDKPAVVAGANLFVRLRIGHTGSLGQLGAAGVLPREPLWITGTLGGGVVESMLAGKPPSLGALDFSLAAHVPSFVPAPFTMVASPKLTFGDATFTFARTAGTFVLAGEQKNSKLLIGGRTIAIPSTKLTFATNGGGYDVNVEGASNEQWRDAFGLAGVVLKSVSVVGRISSAPVADTPPIKGFGLGLAARVTIDRKDFDGQFAIAIKNNKLEEMTLGLTGALDLGFLGAKDFTFKQFALAFTPATQQVALAGELQWRSISGRAAVVMAKQPIVLMGVKNLDLALLAGPNKPTGPALPKLDVLLTAGFASKASDVTNLPSVAQALIDEFAGASSKVKIANGIGLVTKADPKMLGVDKLGVTGSLLLAGSVDLIKNTFRIAATLPTMPRIPGLPKGFGADSPEVFVAVDQKAGTPVASFGLGLRLLFPADKQQLAFKGSLAGSSAGTFSFTGSLETNWDNPFGLTGVTVLAPVVATIGVSSDASVDLGLQAGMAIAKNKYAPMAMCVNLQAAAPAPVPKKLAFKFKGSEIGPKVQLELLEALVKSVVNGPLKSATTDAATRAALAKIKLDKVDTTGASLGLPSFGFKDVDVAVTTPGVTCDLPAIEGMGFKLVGTAAFQGKDIGKVDAFANLTQGFKIDAQVSEMTLAGVLKLSGVHLDLLAPMPGMGAAASKADAKRVDKLKSRLAKRKKSLAATTKALAKEDDADDKADLADEKDDLKKEIADLEKQIARSSGPDPGHFNLAGKADVMGARAAVSVTIDKLGAEFGFSAELADLGKVALSAATEGSSMAKADDFVIGIAADDAGDRLLAKLGAAIKASAATRKQFEGDVSKGTDATVKAAQAEADRLDKTAGKDYRAAKKSLKTAQRKLKKARRAIDKAKDKCEDDLGALSDLCDTLDAAKETLKVAKSAVGAAKDGLKAIKKSGDYVRLKAAQSTIATLKAGKDLVKAGLAGWAAVDKIGQMVADGASKGVISVEEMQLSASLRQLAGSLDVTIEIGDTDIDKSFDIVLTPSALDLTELADDIADEITAQAVKKDSPVWKQLRKKK